MPNEKGDGQKMMRPDDPRALRSRAALREALLRLIDRQPFDEVTIKDVTAEAGVSYPVFFRRYSSKAQLLEDLATEEVSKLLKYSLPALDIGSPSNQLGDVCDYVQSNRKLWTTLLTAGAASVMRNEFIRLAEEIGAARTRSNPWLPLDLAAAFVAAGVFEILSWWLRQPEDYPVRNVISLLDVLVVRSTAKPVDIRLE